MQPTTNQTVPANSSVVSQATDRQPVSLGQAPIPLDAEALRQISGGVTTLNPNNNW
ncbi:MAG: hypothetical protein H7Z15_06065 [Rhizobacter sp.]|nr:hypothetical protein [Rhizobacter sp.]